MWQVSSLQHKLLLGEVTVENRKVNESTDINTFNYIDCKIENWIYYNCADLHDLKNKKM